MAQRSPSIPDKTSVLDSRLKRREGLQCEPVPKSHGLPNRCQSSSIFQSGLDWSQWLHGRRLCAAVHRAAPPPAFLWHRRLLLRGRFCRFPPNGAFSRNFSWLSSLQESRWLFFGFHTIWSRWAQPEVSAAPRGRAGKASPRVRRDRGALGGLDASWMLPRALP